MHTHARLDTWGPVSARPLRNSIQTYVGPEGRVRIQLTADVAYGQQTNYIYVWAANKNMILVNARLWQWWTMRVHNCLCAVNWTVVCTGDFRIEDTVDIKRSVLWSSFRHHLGVSKMNERDWWWKMYDQKNWRWRRTIATGSCILRLSWQSSLKPGRLQQHVRHWVSSPYHNSPVTDR